MNSLESRVAGCVSAAIREVNELRPADEQLGDDGDTVLLGEGGALDSLGLVNFAVTLEAFMEREFGEAQGVVAALLGVTDPEPVRTVDLMAQFLSGLVTQRV